MFKQIVEHEEGRTFVNAGPETVGMTAVIDALLDQLQHEVRTPWPGTRFDGFTFRLAMSYLEKERPRVMYLAFDETDDWAHDGRSEQVLATLAQTDRYLETLWTWLQKDKGSRDARISSSPPTTGAGEPRRTRAIMAPRWPARTRRGWR